MRYGYTDVYNAVLDANKLLVDQGLNYRIQTEDTYNFISLQSKDILTNKVTILFEGLTRDEAYYWLEGLNTGLLNKK